MNCIVHSHKESDMTECLSLSLRNVRELFETLHVV